MVAVVLWFSNHGNNVKEVVEEETEVSMVVDPLVCSSSSSSSSSSASHCFLHPQASDSSINGCASEHSIICGQNEYTDKYRWK